MIATTMLYKAPSKNKSCQGNTGFTTVDKVKFDYVIVEDKNIDAYVSKGWSKTADAKPKKVVKKVAKSLLED